jgi:hypothetical protein
VKILPRVEHCRAQITNILYLSIFIYIFEVNMSFYYILSSNKGICVWPIWPEVNCPYFHTPENDRLLDYYKIISISRPILAQANMGLDFVSGQYGCLFSRCRKYVINSLIHGHFHIDLVIIPRPILAFDCVSGQYGGLGMITRPIWKCPCINL